MGERSCGLDDARPLASRDSREGVQDGKVQVVPFSRQARAIVEALPAPEFGPYILSSLAGTRPISDFSGAKAKLDTLIKAESEAALTPWVVHDLRRSMATHMERLGIAPHIIEVCLGHTLKGIGATYRHYSYLPEKKAALQQWADELVPPLAEFVSATETTRPSHTFASHFAT